jgi:tetratricopeptide (TPR) repeat protein
MPGRSGRIALAIGAALGLLTAGVYARVAWNGFIRLDDNDYVTASPHVQAGLSWSSIRWAFTTGHSANWHPLTWLSHMVDVQLFGMNPAGHHLTSLVLHVASTLLLFRLFLKTTGELWPSAFVGAVFGLHPLHVESVAWVAERKDVLSAFFWILTTLAYVAWTEERRPGRYALVVVLYALGLMSKPMLVTLPFTLLLLDVWPLGRGARRWREKIPLFVLAAASSAVTFLVQRAQGAMALSDRVPLPLRIENAVVACAAYLGKALVPVGLAVYYPHPGGAYPIVRVVGSALLLAAISGLVFRYRRERPCLPVGWLWFLGTLVPVIGLVQVGSQAMADRYTYVPMIGLSAAVAFGVPAIAPALLIAGALVWTPLTFLQVGLWRDDRTLFGHLVEVMPGNRLAHHILGCVDLGERRLDDAIREFEEALRIAPGYAEAISNLGVALELSGRADQAAEKYEEALRFSPGLAEAHHNLGRLLLVQHRLAPAIEHLEAALRSNPDLVEAHANLGDAFLVEGRRDDAIAQYQKALELRPGWAEIARKLELARSARGGRP